MANKFYKLRDPGTSYYNMAQQVSIVSRNVVELRTDEHVRQALKDRRLVEVTDQNEIDESQKEQAAHKAQIQKNALAFGARSVAERTNIPQPLPNKELAEQSLKAEKEGTVAGLSASPTATLPEGRATNAPAPGATIPEPENKQQQDSGEEKKAARAALEASYKEATGADAKPEQTDTVLQGAVNEANTKKSSGAAGKTTLADLAKDEK